MSRFDSVGLAKQTGSGAGGLGTKNTTMEYFVPSESGSPGPNREQMEREETVGHRFPTEMQLGSRFFEPSFTGACRGGSLPRLLSGFLGDPLTTTPDAAAAPSARNHNFDPVARPTLRAHSILMNRTDPSPAITDLYWDALGQELSLSIDPNDWIAFEAAYVAREIDDTLAEPSVTFDATRRFAFYECKCYISVAGGAETEIKVANWGLTYNNGVPTDQLVLGSRSLYRIQEGNANAEVTFTPKGETASPNRLLDFYRRLLADDPEELKIRLEALGPVIGGAVRHKVEVIVHACREIDAPADISAADLLTDIEVTARAEYKASTGKFVEGNVVNTVGTY